jgi:ribonuclease VapC
MSCPENRDDLRGRLGTIAIIVGEPEANPLADLLQPEHTRLCSVLSVWEMIAGLCHGHTFSVPAARTHVGRYLSTRNFRFVSIGEREFEIAVDAYAQYGKGRHAAALNMGDCYAYACAKAHEAKLLFKGDDFTKTDITPAG